jgi:gluconolactonase
MTRGCVVILDAAGTLVDIIATGAGPNGLTEGADGRLYVAQSGGSGRSNRVDGVTGGVQVIGKDRHVRWITQDPITPNDLCFGPDGWLYVTDPLWNEWNQRRDDGRLWRCDPETGRTELLASVGWFPNGIGFGPEDQLYVADTKNSRIMRFEVLDNARLSEESVFCQLQSGGPDGFAFDESGQLIVCCIQLSPEEENGGHLEVVSRDGEVVGIVKPGDSPLYTNVAIDRDGRMLVTDTGGGSVIEGRWEHPGLALHPFRSDHSA